MSMDLMIGFRNRSPFVLENETRFQTRESEAPISPSVAGMPCPVPFPVLTLHQVWPPQATARQPPVPSGTGFCTP